MDIEILRTRELKYGDTYVVIPNGEEFERTFRISYPTEPVSALVVERHYPGETPEWRPWTTDAPYLTVHDVEFKDKELGSQHNTVFFLHVKTVVMVIGRWSTAANQQIINKMGWTWDNDE